MTLPRWAIPVGIGVGVLVLLLVLLVLFDGGPGSSGAAVVVAGAAAEATRRAQDRARARATIEDLADQASRPSTVVTTYEAEAEAIRHQVDEVPLEDLVAQELERRGRS